MNNRQRRVWLNCDHEVWFKTENLRPDQGEQIWCVRCQEYRTVGEYPENVETYWPDYQWTSKPIGKLQHLGICAIAECGHEIRGTFESIRAKMEIHHITRHSHSSLLRPREEKIPEKLPRNASPPF